MESYTSFAGVYDLFMDNVPYEEWSHYLADTFREYGIRDGLILDLGCGTGKLTRLMESRGYDMIGVDSSYEMLDIAREQDGDSREEEEQGGNILYLMQDMREFELYGTVGGIYSACDCVNYILEEEEIEQVFSLVNNYLDPEGIFIFDINSSYKYEELLGDNTFAENREEGSFIWENYYDEETGINQYDLTLYIGEEDGRFLRFEEVHYQKNYSLSTIRRLLEKAGLEYVAAYDGYTKEPVREDSERIVVIAREKGKTKVD